MDIAVHPLTTEPALFGSSCETSHTDCNVRCPTSPLLPRSVTEYGAVTLLNTALVYCGDFGEINDEVSKIFFYRIKLISNYLV